MRKRKDLLDSVKEKAVDGVGICKVFITQMYLYYTVSDMDSDNQLGRYSKFYIWIIKKELMTK